MPLNNTYVPYKLIHKAHFLTYKLKRSTENNNRTEFFHITVIHLGVLTFLMFWKKDITIILCIVESSFLYGNFSLSSIRNILMLYLECVNCNIAMHLIAQLTMLWFLIDVKTTMVKFSLVFVLVRSNASHCRTIILTFWPAS